jgi:hypothetical protein
MKRRWRHNEHSQGNHSVDADPVFSRLLAGDEEKGFSDVVLDGMVDYKSDYIRNTALVETILTDAQGNAVRITDFAPRFRQYGRMFRPPQLFRIIEPIAGLPRITIRVRPTHSYGKAARAYGVRTRRAVSGRSRRDCHIFRRADQGVLAALGAASLHFI